MQDGRGRKRPISTCVPCYTRKQKVSVSLVIPICPSIPSSAPADERSSREQCSRQYPCNHCTRRRRPEECVYGSPPAPTNTAITTTTTPSSSSSSSLTRHTDVTAAVDEVQGLTRPMDLDNAAATRTEGVMGLGETVGLPSSSPSSSSSPFPSSDLTRGQG